MAGSTPTTQPGASTSGTKRSRTDARSISTQSPLLNSPCSLPNSTSKRTSTITASSPSTATGTSQNRAAMDSAATVNDLYARAQAMGLKLTREDIERTRAGVAAIVKRNKASPSSSATAPALAANSSPLCPSTAAMAGKKMSTPRSARQLGRLGMVPSSGSTSALDRPRLTLEQVSLRKEQDGEDRRRKRQRRKSEGTPRQPLSFPDRLLLGSSSSSSYNVLDFSSPHSQLDSGFGPQWRWMDRSGRPRVRPQAPAAPAAPPRMTLDQVGIRAEVGSEQKRRSRTRRRTAEDGIARPEYSDTDSIHPDDDDILPLLLSLPSTGELDQQQPLPAGMAGRVKAEDDAEATAALAGASATDRDEQAEAMEDVRPTLAAAAEIDDDGPSKREIDEDMTEVEPSSSRPRKRRKKARISDLPPSSSSFADPSFSHSASRENHDEEDLSLSFSNSSVAAVATQATAADEVMEAWDYADGTRVVKLVSEELAHALRSGTLSETEVEPRYFTLPAHWGSDKTKPAHASYAGLIGLAILSSSEGKLGLAEIYQWINTTFPYYEMRDRGWQNSIRHNLSLNKSFVKVERSSVEKGKGALWAIEAGHEARFENGTYNAKKTVVAQRQLAGAVTDNEADDEEGGGPDDSRDSNPTASSAKTKGTDIATLMRKHGGSQVLSHTLQNGTSHKYYKLKRDPGADVASGLAVAVSSATTGPTKTQSSVTPVLGGRLGLSNVDSVPASQESVRTEMSLASAGPTSSTPARVKAGGAASRRGGRTSTSGTAAASAKAGAAITQALSKAKTVAARAAAKVGGTASKEANGADGESEVPAEAEGVTTGKGRRRVPLKDKTNVGKGGPAAAASSAKGKGKAKAVGSSSEDADDGTAVGPSASGGAPMIVPSAVVGSNSTSTSRWAMRSPISSLRTGSMGAPPSSSSALKNGNGSVMLPIAGLTPARRILAGHASLGSSFSPLMHTPGGLGSGLGSGLDLGMGLGGLGMGGLRNLGIGANTGLGNVMSPIQPLSSALQTPARGLLSGSATGTASSNGDGPGVGHGHGRAGRRDSTNGGAGGGGLEPPPHSSWMFSSTPIRRLMSGAGSESGGERGAGASLYSPTSSTALDRNGSPYARSSQSRTGSGLGRRCGGGGSSSVGIPSSSLGTQSTPSAAVAGPSASTGLTPAGEASWLGDPFGYQGNFSHELAFTTDMGGFGNGIDSSPAKDLWRS
ncbi:hypothetical protein V8E36_003590 [Tilletia maclaganii]